ncbi:MAG: 4Fe-4S dicluster domain-containing protein, partial [Nitrososphaerota archaeon]|nr:4Fe-4S dicluster domain-containing protein [Nitrososphaerota archaeon]
TKCVGCRACMMACREEHGLPDTAAPDLTGEQFTVVKAAAGKDGEVDYRRMCMHCLEPTCASVCPVGVFGTDHSGRCEVVNEVLCFGCMACVAQCADGGVAVASREARRYPSVDDILR